ncbi:neuraminidase-like domain-containing protein [Nocardia sp. NPDC050175]|uniref:Tc toxin subunit A-related protein n=1 Tax=Nocardia sp. NPDC050175 TaxID=3364317 RepID=UPI0037A7795E
MTANEVVTQRSSVVGRVTDPDGNPVAGAVVTVIERRLRSETPLGESITEADGRYRVEVDAAVRGLVVRAAHNGAPEVEATRQTVGNGATVDLRLPAGSEYATVVARVTPLLDGAALSALGAADVDYLADATGQDRESIAQLAVAEQQAAELEQPGQLCYGMLRQGLSQDLDELGRYPSGELIAAIEAAAAAGVIESAEGAADFAAAIRARHVTEAVNPVDGSADTESVGALIAAVIPDVTARERSYAAYVDHLADAATWLTELSADPVAGQYAERLRLAFRLRDLTGGNAALIRELLGLFDSGEFSDLRELVRLNGSWSELVQKSGGVPEQRRAALSTAAPDGDHVPEYARDLRRRLIEAYPSAYLSHEMSARPEHSETASARFLLANPDFDIIATPVNADTVPDEPARQELGAIQRTFKITRDFDAMQALRDNGFDSAKSVAAVGRDLFARKVSGTLDADAANAVHERATRVSAAAANLVTDFRTAGHFDVPWLPSMADPTGLGHPIPDWEELFGPADYGTFAASRSVTGEPAYLADLLYFLRRLGGGTPTNEGPVAKALYHRRPDLWDVELSDANTDLSLPYVDLVNELLESAVAPTTAVPAKNRQSTGDQATLRIQPQHVNSSAYETLRTAIYPWDLPFDLFRAQTDAYLAHAGVSRVALLETIGAAVDSPTLSMDERLGLNTVAARLIAGEQLPPPRTLAEYYGLRADVDIVGVLRNVRALLDAGSLRYAELTELLDTRFINPDGVIFIKADDAKFPYDTTRMTLVGLDPAALDRLHRFVRLRRALGWSAQLLDRAIIGANSQGGLDRATLRTIAAVRTIAARLDLSIEQVLTFYNTIDAHVYRTESEAPLYDRLFLDPAVVTTQPGTPNPFALRADRSELAALGSLTAPAVTAALLAVLQVTDEDLAALTTGPRAVTPNRILDLANLSALVRTVTLAQALSLSIPELLRLIELYGGGGPFPALADVFAGAVLENEVAAGAPMRVAMPSALPAYPFGFEGEVAGGAPMRPPTRFDAAPRPLAYAQTVATERFLDAVDAIKAAGLTVAELDAVLTATLPAQGGIIPDDPALAATLTALRAALQTVYQQTAQTLDERGELTRKNLTLLGWDPALAQEAVATLLGTVTYAANLTSLPENTVFPPKLPIRFSAAEQKLYFTGPMTEGQQILLQQVSTAAEYQAAVAELHLAPRRFVATRMKARRIPVFAARQDIMPADYQMPKALLGKVFYDINDHQLKCRGYLSEAEVAALKGAPSGAAIAAAVDVLFAVQEADIVGPNKFLDATVADTFFNDEHTVPADRFRFVLDLLNPLLRTMLSEITIKQQLGQAAELDPATADLLLGTLLRSTSGPAVLNDFLVPDFVSSDQAVAVTRSAFGRQFIALSRIYRVALVLSRLRVSALELPFVFGYAGLVGWVDLNELPPAPILGPAPLFAKFIRLLDLLRLRTVLPGGMGTLDKVFTAAASPAATTATVVAELAARTGWNTADLGTLTGLLGLSTAARFLDVATMRTVDAAVQLLLRLGVTADRLDLWLHAELTPAAAEAAWQTAKAKHTLADWPVVAPPMQDAIRERQRAALVSYLVANPLYDTNRITVPEWTDANGMHDYFLLDVEMGATQQTTRMAQAIYSIQLFVQRCLLNLEPLVDTSRTELWQQWEWMKQYRLWEANQKVFLYPENYFQPDLRTDKTPFFQDLENEIMQKEITDENATTALHHYLENLDGVARLHPCGSYRDPANGRIYVFARNDSVPRVYYFRTWENRTFWTPWRKIDLDIGSDTLIPVVWQGQLYLFWPSFTQRADAKTVSKLPDGNAENEIKQPVTYADVHLNWSRLTTDGWQEKKIAESTIATKIYIDPTNYPIVSTVAEGTDIFFFEPQIQANGDLVLYVTYNGVISVIDKIQLNYKGVIFRGSFRLSGRYGFVDVTQLTPMLFAVGPDGKFDPATRNYLLFGSGAGSVNNEFENHYDVRITDTRPNGSGRLDAIFQHISRPPNRLLYPFRPEIAWDKFYMLSADGLRSYLLEVTNPDPLTSAWIRVTNFYHPFVEQLLETLKFSGADAMFARNIQLQIGAFDFGAATEYQPTPSIVRKPYPQEDIDFTGTGAYAQYNWELFFDVPLMLAQRLTTNQKFAEAQHWFHRIFDPTDVSGLPSPQRFWRTKPFFLTAGDPADPTSDYYAQRIEEILSLLASGDERELAKLQVWLDNPFEPDVVARLRTTAYQKSVVMKYLDNLIAWGDQLFRQDTGESVNQATQLYLLAAELLGPRPQEVFDPTPGPARSFRDIAGAPAAPNPLVLAEHLVSVGGDAAPVPSITVGVGVGWFDYFRVPRNEKLLGYWDLVADRLTKIRTGRTIDGRVRQLAAFGSVIDPNLLVRAVASGLDLAAVLDDISAPLPHYRFGAMLAKAKELATEVTSFGSALRTALEQRDGEAMARLRSRHERATLGAAKLVKKQQVAEAAEGLEAARQAQALAQHKLDYYASRDFMNGFEITHTVLASGAIVAQSVAAGIHMAGSVTSHLPDIKVGFPTTVGATYGGSNVSNSLQGLANSLGEIASILNGGAALAATVGGYRRRADDWDFQAGQAKIEIEQADKQIRAASDRLTIAELEQDNHDMEIANAREADEFLYGKFTNQELYEWMVGRLATGFFQAYQLAYDVAKRAERAYRHELGVEDSSFINFGYWDSLHKGLLSGEQLMADLNRMDAAYLDANAREFELTKRISLAQLDANALLRLKETGACYVSLPEALFDLDAPGHYFRRIKGLSITVPCVAGPYTGVNLTATLTNSSIRVDTRLPDGHYVRKMPQDTRFRDYSGPIESIVTSTAQDDSGLFESGQRDDRFLPFEGMGAISQWRLSLPDEFRQFDYQTIADVVLHLRYTARDGGNTLGDAAVLDMKAALDKWARGSGGTGPVRVFSARRELADQWQRFLATPADGVATASFRMSKSQFPQIFRDRRYVVSKPELVLVLSRELIPDGSKRFVDCYPVGKPLSAKLAAGTGTPPVVALSADPTLGGLPRAAFPTIKDIEVKDAGQDWVVTAPITGLDPNLLTADGRLDPAVVLDLLLVCPFTLKGQN